MSPRPLLRWSAGALALARLAACSDGPTGPGTLTNPVATAASLAAVDSALRSPATRSFTLFAGAMVARPSALGPAAALAGASIPGLPQPGESPQALSARRARLLGQLAPQFSASGASFQIIPDTLRGSVFRWDSASSSYYRAQTSGGPANGVRFVLYAVDDSTRRISYPLTEVGYADLLDESGEGGPQLHILVKNVDGSVSYVDHTVAVTPAASGFSASARGFVSNGQTGSENRTLRFAVSLQASATETSAMAAVNAALSLNDPAVTIQLAERHTFTKDGGVASIDFQVSRPGEMLALEGIFTVAQITADSAVATVNATVKVNGQVLATVQGTPPDHLTFRDGDGHPLPPGPVLEALGNLSHAADGVVQLVHGLFSPIGNVFGGF